MFRKIRGLNAPFFLTFVPVIRYTVAVNCTTCDKPLRKDNTHGYCRAHRSRAAQNKRYRELNRDKLIEYAKAYYADNRDEMKSNSREQSKIYYSNNKAKKLLYQKTRRDSDIFYRLRCNLRTRLYLAIRNEYKAGSAVRDLGCTIKEFKQHIEKLFQPEMSWDNWGRDTWHLDHIIPLNSFDLSNPQEFKKACHYTNLQPMRATENIAKGCKN